MVQTEILQDVTDTVPDLCRLETNRSKESL